MGVPDFVACVDDLDVHEHVGWRPVSRSVSRVDGRYCRLGADQLGAGEPEPIHEDPSDCRGALRFLSSRHGG